MPDIQFFQTRMGQRFYESTMPELVKQLTRLNELLASLLDSQLPMKLGATAAPKENSDLR